MDYGVGNRVEENNITSSNFNFGNTDFPFLKLNPMVTDKFIGYTFMYRGKDKSLLIDRSNLKAEIYRGIINDIDSGFFVLNGSTINKNIYVSYLTSEMADAYSQYLYKEKSGKPDSSSYRLSALIEQMKMNNENPILVKGNLK